MRSLHDSLNHVQAQHEQGHTHKGEYLAREGGWLYQLNQTPESRVSNLRGSVHLVVMKSQRVDAWKIQPQAAVPNIKADF